MVDLLSRARRSQNMRQIRSKDTKPEMAVRRLLHAMGYRFRLHRSTLPGKPDLVFPRRKKIVDVRGCFWHRHVGCVDSHIPKSRAGYWGPKLRRNVQRDKRNLKCLRELGWRVFVIWECEVTQSNIAKLRSRLGHFLGPR
ncbi:MAG: very short patch repair endonuclease [Candidatus Korobacteraceae bacterium]